MSTLETARPDGWQTYGAYRKRPASRPFEKRASPSSPSLVVAPAIRDTPIRQRAARRSDQSFRLSRGWALGEPTLVFESLK